MTARDAGNPASTDRRRSALIVAGAAGKGPYAAGALELIARDPRFDVSVVVGSSSGALNAAVYAAGLSAGKPAEAAAHLIELWTKQANLRALGSWARRKHIVKEAVSRFAGVDGPDVPIQLRVVVASLPGVSDRYGYVRAEETYVFDRSALRSPSEIDHLAEVCVASAALPVLFAPRTVRGRGPYWDGGIVDNTPLGWALRNDRDVDHVIVVTPDTKRVGTSRYGRFALSRLAQMLIDERLNRDLHEARSFNAEISKLGTLGLSLDTLRSELRWRLLQILEVRPAEELEGSLLAGFFSKRQRMAYVEAGRAAAKKALGEWREEAFA